MIVQFTVPGAAAPQGSKRHVGRGVMVESSKRVKPWRADVREAAFEAMRAAGHRTRQHYDGHWFIRDPIEGPVRVEVDFVYRRPPSHYRVDGTSLSAAGRRAPYPQSRGDLDKLQRALFDAMTGVVFLDDRQVVLVAARKVWGERDYARVLVVVDDAQAVAA